MNYLHELEEKERKIVNSFIMRHSKFLSRLWIIWVTGVIVSIYMSRCTNINFNVSFSMFAFSFVLFWIWMGFISIISIRNNKLLQVQNKISVTKKILTEISDEEYREVSKSLITKSNNLFLNNLFDFVSEIYMKRNDTEIFIECTIMYLKLEFSHISIKNAVEHELFNF